MCGLKEGVQPADQTITKRRQEEHDVLRLRAEYRHMEEDVAEELNNNKAMTTFQEKSRVQHLRKVSIHVFQHGRGKQRRQLHVPAVH